MKWLIPLNLAWLIWLAVRTVQGITVYQGTHSHLYAQLFMAGLIILALGSLLLKWVWLRGEKSRKAYAGFGFWLSGFFALGLSMLLGATVPAVHVLNQHVLFGHVNFMIFLTGLIVSAYLDFRITARFAPFPPRRIWRSEMTDETKQTAG